MNGTKDQALKASDSFDICLWGDERDEYQSQILGSAESSVFPA